MKASQNDENSFSLSLDRLNSDKKKIIIKERMKERFARPFHCNNTGLIRDGNFFRPAGTPTSPDPNRADIGFGSPAPVLCVIVFLKT